MDMFLENGYVSREWTKSILVLIDNESDGNYPDNYRGTSFLSGVSICFTYILNSRLEKID